ncbi:hypothetical protein NDU88_005618 [Pleurodeles waltl]|uniref:Uncharacterized protein n=1 Tax=Pleurodeles waltl TaxID=8319 RepID=A0AAV7TD69_PLEWA|nr:hypothetical protein NDU88_005618 [Pleurodeles waltl]
MQEPRILQLQGRTRPPTPPGAAHLSLSLPGSAAGSPVLREAALDLKRRLRRRRTGFLVVPETDPTY